MKKISLDGEWILYGPDGKKHKAAVPGCVHSDLFSDLDYLFYRDNNEKSKWIENESWVYEREFNIDETEGAYLVFEGLDTYCDIELNGKKLAECDNMFIEHSFYAAPFLKKGINRIKVKFYSPIKQTEGKEKLEGAFTTERLHTRRMQCTYGWDWVERFVTCGIFRPVYIVYKENMYCENAYIYTENIDEWGAEICIGTDFENYTLGSLVTFEITDPQKKLIYEKPIHIDMQRYSFRINIDEPVFWDISGGNNLLYSLRVTVGENVFKQNFGIRTVKILQKKDLPGDEVYSLCKWLQETPSGRVYDKNTEFSSFDVILNGRKVMCRGANWVPCEPFPSAEKDEKITKILEMAKNAGVNIIRVWGGGIFERSHFYDECDRLGIMVIQDFMMACGHYPEKDSYFISQLGKEADFISKKLRNHPSLIWWNGDNENAINGSDSEKEYTGRSASLHGVLPMILKNDYMRNFFVSSPNGGTPNASKTAGTTHNTQFLEMFFDYIDGGGSGDDFAEYMKEYTARFIAEEPCFGAASYESLSKFMTDDDIFGDEKMWIYHTKSSPYLKDEMFNYVKRLAEKLFGKFTDAEDMLFKLQYVQYEWVRVTMENALRNRNFCGGIIYWMLNDCWPAAAGWALIDYYCRPKAGYYAFRKFADKEVLSFDISGNKLWLYLCNDGNEKISKSTEIKEINIRTGQTEKKSELTLECEPHGVTKKEVALKRNPDTVIVAESEGIRAVYKCGSKKLKPCMPPEILSREDGEICLKADSFVYAAELSGGYIYDDNFFTMLPGETKTVHFSGAGSDLTIKAYSFI